MKHFIQSILLLAVVSALCHVATSQEILFETGFESDTWYQKWGRDEVPRNVTLVEADDTLKFVPLHGKAIKITVEKDGHYGTSFDYDFSDQTGEEPEEIYFRYYLRFADSWNPEQGGKLPGIGGTYGRAGWGGRPVHGDDGWSARGLFQGMKNGKTPIGFYTYHMDMRGQYGSSWVWDIEDRGYLENNRWYCIEHYVKLNDPEDNNGILRAWVDDHLAFDKTDLRFRNTDTLKIEDIWINIYHGGSWTAKTEQHLYIDEVAISTNKIGPKKLIE